MANVKTHPKTAPQNTTNDEQIEVVIYGKSYLISKSLLLELEANYIKDQKVRKTEKTCFSGSYASEMDFVRVGWDIPY